MCMSVCWRRRLHNCADQATGYIGRGPRAPAHTQSMLQILFQSGYIDVQAVHVQTFLMLLC